MLTTCPIDSHGVSSIVVLVPVGKCHCYLYAATWRCAPTFPYVSSLYQPGCLSDEALGGRRQCLFNDCSLPITLGSPQATTTMACPDGQAVELLPQVLQLLGVMIIQKQLKAASSASDSSSSSSNGPARHGSHLPSSAQPTRTRVQSNSNGGSSSDITSYA